MESVDDLFWLLVNASCLLKKCDLLSKIVISFFYTKSVGKKSNKIIYILMFLVDVCIIRVSMDLIFIISCFFYISLYYIESDGMPYFLDYFVILQPCRCLKPYKSEKVVNVKKWSAIVDADCIRIHLWVFNYFFLRLQLQHINKMIQSDIICNPHRPWTCPSNRMTYHCGPHNEWIYLLTQYILSHPCSKHLKSNFLC